MKIKAAQIDNGVIVNTLVVDSLDFLPNLVELVGEHGIGDNYSQGVFSKNIPPETIPPVPTKVTMRQARLALHNQGFLNKVNAALNNLPAAEKEIAAIEWEYATEVSKDSPLVQALAGAVGLLPAQLDTLFTFASTL